MYGVKSTDLIQGAIVESISTAELAELVLLSRSSIDFQFNMWITITFALMAAAFATKETLRLSYQVLIVLLYLAATLTLASRGFSDAQETAKMILELQQRDVPYTIPIFTIVMRIAVVILGTLGALIFVLMPHSGLIRQNN